MVELLALTGVIVLISALSSGFLERRGISLVALFLAIGIAAGPHGLGLADLRADSPALRLVATVSLTMVLFADAVSVQPAQMCGHARLGALILGPGTILTAGLIALAAWLLLDIPPAGSAMAGRSHGGGWGAWQQAGRPVEPKEGPRADAQPRPGAEG